MRRAMLGLAVALCLGLSGCASDYVRETPKTAFTNDVIDGVKVVTVNQWAERVGAKVIWVNYPQAHEPKPAGGD